MSKPLTATVPDNQEWEQPPPGNRPAVCVAVIDLGTHTETFKDRDTGEERQKDYRRVFVAWELTNAKMSGSSENHVIGRAYNLTLGRDSALRDLVENWFNKKLGDKDGLDVMKLAGKKCFLNVIHEAAKNRRGQERSYARIKAVTAPPEGATVPPNKHQPYTFNVEEAGGELPDVPSWVPRLFGELLTDVIRGSQEFRRAGAQKPAAPPADGLDETPMVAGAGAPDDSEIPW
jgi:hypothetical protein